MHTNGSINNNGKIMVCAVRSVLVDNAATSLDKDNPFGKDCPGRVMTEFDQAGGRIDSEWRWSQVGCC